MWDKALDLVNGHPYHARLFGALAQLGERNTGSVEVSGSIPLGSTKSPFQKMPQALLTLGDEECYTSRDV